jgi:8-oxo-dGTP pyrophosphatase MutT (NUDIX family)
MQAEPACGGMFVAHKAVCCVVQDDALLCFAHPHAGNQIPKGTVQPGESPQAACLRELREESGLRLAQEPFALGRIERTVGGGLGGCGPLERHTWHLFVLRASGLPVTWTHMAEGSAAESGLAFRFFWHQLSAEPRGFERQYVAVIERLRSSLHAV